MKFADVCFNLGSTVSNGHHHIPQTEDAGDRPTGHYDEFGFMVDGGT